MEKVIIKVKTRKEKGKELVKKLKSEGDIPAVVYGQDVNMLLSVGKDALKALRSIHFSESAIINMEVEGQEAVPVLVKDVQFHPLTEKVIHIDFLKVSLQHKLKVHVPIVVKGDSKGVKEGGTLTQSLRELEIEALPLDIPENIQIDVGDLEIGDSLHVKDLSLPENVKVFTESDETILFVSAHKEEPAPEEAVEEAEVSGKEPEVIKKKKEEETAEEESAGKEKQ